MDLVFTVGQYTQVSMMLNSFGVQLEDEQPARPGARSSVTGRLAGKTALVVGAGQQPGETIGNGKAIALTFAREGAEVLCVDRDLSRAEATVGRDRDGGRHSDRSRRRHRQRGDAIVAAALERWGRIDICVDNVGIGHRGDGPAHARDDDAFETVFAVNFTGARRLVKAVLAPMREAGERIDRAGELARLDRRREHGRLRNIEGRAQPAGHRCRAGLGEARGCAATRSSPA